MNVNELCINLAKCETEKEIISLLINENFWEDTTAWQHYGDNENNFATIGNQQSRPETAIVEKLINSVDAVLMSECLSKGINPESPQSPKNIAQALETYFNIYAGKLSNITTSERLKLAKRISLVATGKKSNPCYSIIDTGEGQTPNKMPDTLLSIGKSNKLRIPFVQGKFNMGGTGVLEFCGKRNLQLIISKRNPDIVSNEPVDESSLYWGFTIVRREDPKGGIRSSFYRYLAPGGNILKFKSDNLPLLPAKYPNPLGSQIQFGTFIKLFEYQMTGLKTNILFDLYNRLSILMPSVALPIRLYERRKGYSGHSLETTLSGLSVRLEEDKSENLENGFSPPPTSNISVLGQTMKVSIFAFKRGQSKKYTKTEGVIFTINGQTHGYLTKAFFSRQSVRMGYLSDSLLIVVDCSDFDGRSRETLFMNSRDRLRSGDLRSRIEDELSRLLKDHVGLKELNQRRRREDIEDKLEDSKPLAEVIETILKKSPTLSNLFIKGIRLPNPFKTSKGKEAKEYLGVKFPTQFKLTNNFSIDNPKICPINNRFRVQYKTDASNDYFDRDSDPGSFSLNVNDNEISDFSVNLWNGIANLNVDLPMNVNPGDLLHFKSIVNDINRVDPFYEEFFILIEESVEKRPSKNGKRKPPSSDNKGKDVDKSSSLDLPNIREVLLDEWDRFNFNRDSALKVQDSGVDDSGYDFFINMDNIHLLTEKKANSKIDNKLLDARYKYGMVLIGIALLKDYDENTNSDDSELSNDGTNIFDKILYFTKIISPILLPLISGLGEIKEEELVMAYEED